jgi:hypothetical protein
MEFRGYDIPDVGRLVAQTPLFRSNESNYRDSDDLAIYVQVGREPQPSSADGTYD